MRYINNLLHLQELSCNTKKLNRLFNYIVNESEVSFLRDDRTEHLVADVAARLARVSLEMCHQGTLVLILGTALHANVAILVNRAVNYTYNNIAHTY